MAIEKVKTLDGARTRVDEINTDAPAIVTAGRHGVGARIAAIYKNLSLVLAGMYTGLGCGGTPNTHHSYDEDSTDKKPDNRPI